VRILPTGEGRRIQDRELEPLPGPLGPPELVERVRLPDLGAALDSVQREISPGQRRRLCRTLDGKLDARSVERRVQELLEANGHQGMTATYRLAVLQHGFPHVTLAITPKPDEQLFP